MLDSKHDVIEVYVRGRSRAKVFDSIDIRIGVDLVVYYLSVSTLGSDHEGDVIEIIVHPVLKTEIAHLLTVNPDSIGRGSRVFAVFGNLNPLAILTVQLAMILTVRATRIRCAPTFCEIFGSRRARKIVE